MGIGVSLRKLKLWCLLVLAAVAAHALLPIAGPEARATGSPFNPSTIDVSTSHARRVEVAQAAITNTDPDSGLTSITLPLLPAVQPATAAHTTSARCNGVMSPTVPALPKQHCSLGQPRAPPGT